MAFGSPKDLPLAQAMPQHFVSPDLPTEMLQPCHGKGPAALPAIIGRA